MILLTVLISALLSACGAGAMPTGGGEPAMPAAPALDAVQGGGAVPEKGGDGTGDERMVIRSKVLRLEVASTPDAVTKVRDLTTTHSGTVEAMQVATDNDEWIYRNDENGYGDGTALRGWVTVRVPSASYEQFVTDVAAIGAVKYQSEATDDVTQQHIDLSARLENLRAQEKRLRDFFDAAENVKEMLSVEQELGRIRGDIESLDAQVKHLERQAAMATVTIELSEPRPVISSGGQSWGFVQAITDGVRGAAGLLTGLITVLIATSPLWIVAIVLFFPIRALIRRRRGAKAPKPPRWSVKTGSVDAGEDPPTATE
ncbi:MAG: DUF4349 domain-containing protein [Tessaracoccus sp.]|uniref:DUF4349 domain-containing protein n=1 Tax=Tessaracoccus sp. TaxID=1971211 RepID=UPI001EBEEED2|nr:DUF4349 domain-containing protein [Tessaracoccus sp.]MBK7821593.1 DUF4349 domain-containing protein [Tessaracoccus sp.]